jgi:tetratricopeptide (TPR) repeat protein
MMKSALLLPVAAMVILTAATGTSAQQPQAPRATVQQQFDSSTAALQAERWDEALRLLEALETRLTRGRDQGSLGIVRVRRGQALLGLGRVEEAVAALRLGLPALSATDPSLNEDRFRAYLTLGHASELTLDYRQAAEHYRAAETVGVEPAFKLLVYRGLIQTQMFHDAPAALADADEALRLAAVSGARGRELEGQFRTFRGRVLLNMDRREEARTELDRAMRLLGGPSLRVNINDVVARSDLAIAAMLTGRADEARRYLALTGAGRMTIAYLPTGSTPAPPCGNGLQPDDVAVVEFSIRDHGGVGTATPVYSSRQGDAALLFAQAVRRWSWPPDTIRQMEPFFRAAVRVELRCSTIGASARIASDGAIRLWSTANNVTLEMAPPTNRTVAELRRDLAAAEARSGAASPQLLPLLVRLGSSQEVPAAEKVPHLRRAVAIAASARAPLPYREMIGFQLIGATYQASGRGSETFDHRAVPAELSNDPELVAAFLFATVHTMLFRGEIGEAEAVLAQARAIPAIRTNPVLVPRMAELEIAIHAARGNDAAARAAYGALPAGTYPCNPPVRLRRARASSADFPNPALNWGFGGWVAVETLVGAGGQPASSRALVAYPPFVFNQAALDILARGRFEPVFVPPGGPCAAHWQRIVFNSPDF